MKAERKKWKKNLESKYFSSSAKRHTILGHCENRAFHPAHDLHLFPSVHTHIYTLWKCNQHTFLPKPSSCLLWMKSQSQSVKVTMTIQYALTNNSEKMKIEKKNQKIKTKIPTMGIVDASIQCVKRSIVTNIRTMWWFGLKSMEITALSQINTQKLWIILIRLRLKILLNPIY